MKLKNLSIVISTIFILLFLSGCTNWSVTYTGDYCADNLQDRTETDVDCGGLYCDPCEEGYACEDDSDCSSENCESGLCATETYDATTADSDNDGVVDASDVCDGEDDTIDVDEDEIADCVDDDLNTYIGGSVGLSAEFLDFNLNENGYNEVTDGDSFPLIFILENNGEYTIGENEIELEIRGISDDDWSGVDFEMTNSQEITAISNEQTEGGSEEINFGDAIYEGLTGTFYQANIYLEYTYPYQTHIIIPEVCFKEDLHDESLCEVSESKTTFVSAGPIQVGTVVEEPYGSGRIYLEIPIYNADDGRSKAYSSNDFSAVYDSLLFDVETEGMECTSRGDSPVALMARSTDTSETTIICISDVLEEDALYTDQVEITLTYYYQDLAETEVRINSVS